MLPISRATNEIKPDVDLVAAYTRKGTVPYTRRRVLTGGSLIMFPNQISWSLVWTQASNAGLSRRSQQVVTPSTHIDSLGRSVGPPV